jgi:hypothetical protein
MEKLELERMEVLFLPYLYFISSHARVDDGSIDFSLFLSFFFSFFLSFVWDGIRLLFVVGSELSAVSAPAAAQLSSKWEEGRMRERGHHHHPGTHGTHYPPRH